MPVCAAMPRVQHASCPRSEALGLDVAGELSDQLDSWKLLRHISTSGYKKTAILDCCPLRVRLLLVRAAARLQLVAQVSRQQSWHEVKLTLSNTYVNPVNYLPDRTVSYSAAQPPSSNTPKNFLAGVQRALNEDNWVVVKTMVPFGLGSLLQYGTQYLGGPKSGP